MFWAGGLQLASFGTTFGMSWGAISGVNPRFFILQAAQIYRTVAFGWHIVVIPMILNG